MLSQTKTNSTLQEIQRASYQVESYRGNGPEDTSFRFYLGYLQGLITAACTLGISGNDIGDSVDKGKDQFLLS